jgi:hypothetical protein
MPFVPEISAEFSAPTGYSSTAPLHPSSEVSVASIMRLSGRFFTYVLAAGFSSLLHCMKVHIRRSTLQWYIVESRDKHPPFTSQV